VGLFLVVQLGALALVPEFAESGYQAVDNPDNPTNSLLYIAAIIAMTGLMLAAFRYDLDQGDPAADRRRLRVALVVRLLCGRFAARARARDRSGRRRPARVPRVVRDRHRRGVDGRGRAGLFGISFGLLPALLLLAFLAVYDAISVYGTEHMLSLAEGVMDLNIPVVLVIPLSLSYSLLGSSRSEGGGR